MPNAYLLRLIFALILLPSFAFANAPARQYVEGEYIVKLKESAKGRATNFIDRAKGKKNLELKNRWQGLNMYHFRGPAGGNFQATLDELRSDPDVEYAEPNFLFSKAQNEDISNKMSYSPAEVQSMSSGGSYLTTDAPIQAPEAWAAAVGTSIPIIAVIDTGVDITHPVFVNSGAIWSNPGEVAGNGVDDDMNGFVDDVNGYNFVSNSSVMLDDDGHGTHVAGIVLGVTQDIFETPIAPAKIRIMPLKFLDGDGVGRTSDAVKAIYYAVNNGATILNNSWGGSSYSASLHEAVTYAYDQGVSFVAAAGNSASNNDFYPMYPASYNVPNIIAVAATTDADGFAYFSNFGVSTVHLGSPGYDILSTYPGNLYVSMRGTSMAAPFVAGVAALLKREEPAVLGYQMKTTILGSGNNLSILSSRTITSNRLNAYNSVLSIQGTAVSTSQPAYVFSSQERALASTAGGCGTVTKLYREMREGKGGNGPSAPPTHPLSILIVVGLMTLPVLLWRILRRPSQQRRRYDRFKINTEVKVAVDGKELVGSISSISLGGAQLNTDALLEHGGIVKMQILSPDGSGTIDVEGQVVWSEAKKAYGVQFQDAQAGVLDRIAGWTRGLSKI